jgi:peptidoglycan/xylan/chitin deacetylase (PgdA/CDA1 family)
MWILFAIAVALVALAHTAPAPFALDWMAGDRARWHMPRTDPPTVYLTYDDGPNPATTPALLDALAGLGARATFFVIDRHITEATAPIVARMFTDGHAVALHSESRRYMFLSGQQLAAILKGRADRIRALTGRQPCPVFRPHGGWRSHRMYAGLRRLDYRLVGWGWMLWDVDYFRRRTAARIVGRILPRVRAGDIVVIHDGDEKAPARPQPQAVEATVQLVEALSRRGFRFATICG